MGTPVATFTEAASLISRVHGSEDTRDMCSFYEVISDDSCAYWDIDRKVELPRPTSPEALNMFHQETLALSVARIKAFLAREYVGQEDIPAEAFLVLGACTAEESSFHVLLRKQLGGPVERGEFRHRLVRQKAVARESAAVLGTSDLLRLQGHEGARMWGTPKALAESEVSVYFVNGPDERACPAREGEIHRSNTFFVRVSAAGELWYQCLVGTCSGRRRIQPPEVADEGVELAGASAVGQQEEADKRRRTNVNGSALNVAETESRGAGDRHAVSRGMDRQATPTTVVDDSPPLGRLAVGCAGVMGLEQQRTTGKRRRSPVSGDALGGAADGRSMDVQRIVSDGTRERHAAVGDADELSVAEGRAKGPSVDERRPAGGGVDALDRAEWCAAGAKTAGELRPAGGGVAELDMTRGLADEGIGYELFHTSHVMDGMRCRSDFKPSMADDAKRPDGTPHAMLGELSDKSGLVDYIKACIIATGDRLLFQGFGHQPYGDMFRLCSTDAVQCLKQLAAVGPRPATPDGLEVCTYVDGPHWQILLAAAQFAYDRAYNTPYANPCSEEPDDCPHTYLSGHSPIHRRNHSLAHALRQA
ncbi:hypothetical protein CYMTET_12661 [Cymbomonas tetramitiformis]|uniref:Uncharacterized protein n=1 Tax=Cymbomonas tetramitiformis TaxID=36881 RepID=A0AAE0GJP2_9CHLO|nr:hypothetical protein CYMTET_12661 [Cymbomonas tetramitiformis]